MAAASSVAAFLALAWAAALTWLAIGAALRRAGMQRRARAPSLISTAGRRVLIVRPCAGAEPGLLDNLASIQAIETRASLSLVMCVDAPDDAALPVIEAALERLRAAGAQLDARCEIHPPSGPNRKASMFAAVLAAAGDAPELVVNVDSNVDLGGYPLDELLTPLLDPQRRVGAVWGPWSEQRTAPGLGPRASAAVLGASLTAFPLLCGIYAYGLCGKIWASRRDILAGCEPDSLAHYLGEDLELARRLRADGLEILAAATLGRARGGSSSFAATVARFGRWMAAVRGQRPALLATYPLCFFATPIVLALAGLGLLARPTIAAWAVGLALAARMLVTLAAQYWSGRRLGLLRALVEAALGDIALGLAWLRAVTRREVEWRGHRLRVEPDGRLRALDPDPPSNN